MWYTTEDARRLDRCARAYEEGFRNIVNDPEYINKQKHELYIACSEMKEKRRRQAIYSIKKQPFYA